MQPLIIKCISIAECKIKLIKSQLDKCLPDQVYWTEHDKVTGM